MHIDPQRGAYRRRTIDDGAERRLYPDMSTETVLTEPIDASPLGKLQGARAPYSSERFRNEPGNNIAAALPEGLDQAYLDLYHRQDPLGTITRTLSEPGRSLTDQNIEAVQTFGERAADALPLGFGDEIASTLVAPFTDRPNFRQEYLQERAARSARNRAASIAGTVVGSLPAAFMLAGSAGPPAAAGAVERLAIPWSTRIANSLRGAALEGLRGGAIGGVTGVGLSESDDLAQRARSGLIGAALGAPLGAAGRLIGDAAGALSGYLQSPLEAANRYIGATAELGEGPGVANTIREFLSPESGYTIRSLNGEMPSAVIPTEGPALRQAALQGERRFANLGTPLDDISEPIANDLTQMARQFSDIETGVGGFQNLKNERLAQAFQLQPPGQSWAENVTNQISLMRNQLSNIEQRAAASPRVARGVQEALFSLDEADRLLTGGAQVNSSRAAQNLLQEAQQMVPMAERLLGSRSVNSRATNALMNEVMSLQDMLSSSSQYLRPSNMSQLSRSVDRISRQLRQIRNSDGITTPIENQLVELSGSLERMRNNLTPSISRGTGSPAEIYDLMNKANMSIGRATSAETGGMSPVALQHTTAFQQPLERLYESTRSFLRNPSVWGDEAVGVQAQLNDAVSPLLRTGRAASRRLGNLFVDSGEEAASGFRSYPEANPNAVRGIVSRAADPAHEGERQLLRDWVSGYGRHGESLANLSNSPENRALATDMQSRAARLLNFINQVEEQGQAAARLEQIAKVSARIPGFRNLTAGQVIRTLARIEAGEIPSAPSRSVELLFRGIERIARGVQRSPGVVAGLTEEARQGPRSVYDESEKTPASRLAEYDAVDRDPFGLGDEDVDGGQDMQDPDNDSDAEQDAQDTAAQRPDIETLREDGEYDYDAVDRDPFGLGEEPDDTIPTDPLTFDDEEDYLY